MNETAFSKICSLLDHYDFEYEIFQHQDVFSFSEITGRSTDLPFPLENLFKTIAFVKPDKTYLFAVLRGRDRILYHNLSLASRIPRSKIKKADPVELETKFGLITGTLAPIPFSTEISVIIDETILKSQEIYCGSGSTNKTIKIKSYDLLCLPRVSFANLCQSLK